MIEDIVDVFVSSVLKRVVPFQGFTKSASKGILNLKSDQNSPAIYLINYLGRKFITLALKKFFNHVAPCSGIRGNMKKKSRNEF